MSIARKLTFEDLQKLSWGGVVWCVKHGDMDCGKYGTVKYYVVFPMMLTYDDKIEPEKILTAGTAYSDDIKLNKIPSNYHFWSNQPEAEQFEEGRVSIDDALKIFNKYENEKMNEEK